MRRPRVKLITIPWELEVPTLSLATLASVTPPHFDICIVDLLRERLFLDEPTDLVGISASTPRINAAYALADLYRSKGVTVVLGGHHATALPEEALAHADAVVCGEGETSWMRICDEFLSNPSRVSGIYRDPPPDLAALPQPRIDLMKLDRYGSFYYPIIASRGCPEKCGFCFAKRMTQGFRTYPIAHVIEQVKRRPAFIRSMYFVDDNLPADPDHSRELFFELSKLKVPFGMQARNEFALDRDRLAQAHDAGCVFISSGYESVSQQTLDRTGKRAQAGNYRQAAANIYDAGIMGSGNWMFGFDSDTPEVFEETLEFLDSSDLLHSTFTTEIPFPGTAIWRRYEREGRLLSHDYDAYVGKGHVIVRPTLMSEEQLWQGIRWLTTQYYSPRRAARRIKRAVQNKKLASLGPRALRTPALVFLGMYQVYQWHYRMVPSLNWLYERLVSVNKHKYLKDHLRRTNFWSRDHVRASEVPGARFPPLSSASPFLHRAGYTDRREQPLAVEERLL
ncbi:MAG: B12-binding domain-containing radical SAM protein [Deltaproteobacteria bacterium]|nr:B12-binding domain-containing radical SAM protein [Deltaproteobacteria bacterium]